MNDNQLRKKIYSIIYNMENNTKINKASFQILNLVKEYKKEQAKEIFKDIQIYQTKGIMFETELDKLKKKYKKESEQ